MATFIDAPSQFSGTEMSRIGQIYTYLYKVHEQLNLALGKLDAGEFSSTGQAQIAEVVRKENEAVNASEFDTLRSLITKNAKYVESSMDAIVNTLESSYVAQSEFGEYRQTAETQFVQNALYAEQNTVVEQQINALENYRSVTEGHIRYGIIGTKEDGSYDYGIAVGERIETTSVSDDENEMIKKQDFLAIYAANRLEFWQGEVKLATFEGDRLTVGTLNVSGSIEQGSWKWDNSNGLALLWIGE